VHIFLPLPPEGGTPNGAVSGFTPIAAGATMTLKWMADRLKMGAWTHVANRLYHLKK
jgi:hypothetical protein